VAEGVYQSATLDPVTSYTGKRLFDISVALVLLFFAIPLFLGITIAIRRPIFFMQRRGGHLNRSFTLLKFRTMYVGSPDTHQAVRDDPRVTRLGALLRSTNLDELPQLLNVLRGDMSIVGPRPHPLWLDRKYERLAGYRERFQVRPGLTGLAQVNGLRGETTDDTMAMRVEYDLKYIRNQSLALDLMILLRTVGCMWRQMRALRLR
jgi:lipopolysaccharide/colanic/teichoic acid biosynthesis glycosyltransferase